MHGSHYRKLVVSILEFDGQATLRVQRFFVTINRKQLRDPSVRFYRREREVRESLYNLVHLTFASISFYHFGVLDLTGRRWKVSMEDDFSDTVTLTAFA